MHRMDPACAQSSGEQEPVYNSPANNVLMYLGLDLVTRQRFFEIKDYSLPI